MKNIGNAFLNTQYPNLSSSKEVKRAVIASGEARIGNKEERTGFYFGRLEKILTRKRYGGGKSGQDMLEYLLVAEMVLDMEDEELVLKLAKGLYESQKRIAIERGQGSDVEKYEMNDGYLIEKYKGAIREKAEIQKRSLGAWFTYLKENDAQYPLWFRYYVVRSLMDMGQFNRDDVTYTNRSETTISPYPEMNAEALAFVYKSVEHQLSTESVPQEVEEAIIRDVKLDEDIRVKIAMLKEESQYNATQSALKNARAKARTEYIQKQKEKQNKTFLEGVSLDDDRKEELSEELLKRLGTKKFSNLYAFAQVETAGNLDRESLVGEWVKYDKGSDYLLLEKGLKGKGTGWCTAEGSASSQLEAGDFYVYYTNNKKGVATEPRIAIRMASDKIAEIRGVDPRQELEPVLLDTAREFYKELPGAEKYEKATKDMKQMTMIYNKCFTVGEKTKEKVYVDAELTKEEIRFLYEIDGEIEGFGYEKDFRVEEIRRKRNKKDDLYYLCDCDLRFIADSVEDIKETTQVFLEVKGEIITIVDFREDTNKMNLLKIINLKVEMKLKGSVASLDMASGGGVVSFDISFSKTSDFSIAIQSYEYACKKKGIVAEGWKEISYTAPTQVRREFIVLSYDESKEVLESSEKIIADMDKLGLRPASFEDMIVLGIEKPLICIKKDFRLIGLTTYQISGLSRVNAKSKIQSRVPILGLKYLGENYYKSNWADSRGTGYKNRFVCVRK